MNAKMIVRGKDRTCSMLEPVHLAANKIGLNEVEIGLSDGRRPPSLPIPSTPPFVVSFTKLACRIDVNPRAIPYARPLGRR
jgi:hypothetical protein